MTYGVSSVLQSLARAVFPPQCALCDQTTIEDFVFCHSCWAAAEFIAGSVCDSCGCQVHGGSEGVVHCDDCLANPRPWGRGRAAMIYSGSARRLVLGLKYGDRTELAKTAARLLMTALGPIRPDAPVFVPVPLQYRRQLRRRYNQSALMARALADLIGPSAIYEPQSIQRQGGSGSLRGLTRDERFGTLADSISPHPKHGARLRDRNVVLIDDVMATGATLSAATHASFAAGAKSVCVLTLARATKDA